MKLYKSDELSNARYHSAEFPQISGSELAVVHADCPAALRYGEKKESAAMSLGVAGHALLLEPQTFSQRFVRGINAAEYDDILITKEHITAYIRDKMGRKGYSGKDKAGLIAMIHEAGEDPLILDVMVDVLEFDAASENKTVVPADTFDTVMRMREAIFKNGYSDLLSDGMTEVSLIDEEKNLKCRPDFLGNYQGGVAIIDYKTTTSAHPEIFGRQAHNMHYWLKMALQRDMVADYCGEVPRVILLAQSTKKPYIPQAYELEEQQLDAGREQYMAAKRYLEGCKASDSWPAYGGGILPLQTPGYIANQYGFEDRMQIIQE